MFIASIKKYDWLSYADLISRNLKKLTSSRIFWICLGIFYIDNHIICKLGGLISSFPIHTPFISFSWLPANSSTMLYRIWESEHLCLILSLRRKAFSLSPCMILSYRFCVDILYKFEAEEIPFYSYSAKSFYHEQILNFSFFLHQLIWSYGLSCISLLMWRIASIDFQMLNLAFIPRIKPAWLWYIILLLDIYMYAFYICYWIQFANFFQKFYFFVQMRDTGL